MPKEFINPDTHATPTGYTHAVKTGNLVFVAGQVSRDKSGEVVGVGDAAAQTKQVLANLDAAVQAAGGTLGDIVSTTVYMVNRDDLPAFREARGEFWGSHPPTSTLLLISGLALPEFLIEIKAVAVLEG
jgi:enamine deaminase RidA (YjgF/YER057c/UK114 family)